MAMNLPELAWTEPKVRRVGTTGDSVTWEITVGWKNTGRLPTALRQAQLVKVVREDAVTLTLPADATSGERPRARIIADGPARARRGEGTAVGGGGGVAGGAARSRTVAAGWTEPGQARSVKFRVQTIGGQEPLRGELRLDSTRGGVLRGQVEIR
jgi:hypothetical protein